jgi:ADP-ribose pyrophosphatase YjhB (NUDIX family)
MHAETRPGRTVLWVDIVVCDDSAVLLVRPTVPPDRLADWGLPGTALPFGEAPQAAARRVLHDTVGLDMEDVRLADVESTIRDGVWTLTFHFRCDADRPPQARPQIAEARFFQIEHLPPTAHGTREREIIFRVLSTLAPEP